MSTVSRAKSIWETLDGCTCYWEDDHGRFRIPNSTCPIHAADDRTDPQPGDLPAPMESKP